MTSDSGSWAPTTLGTIEKGQKLDYEKLSLIKTINYHIQILAN